ncbi:hypothetical protein KEM52_000230 [Ascosphaera acerosa]|nr:hypothetical protein KEM52_000230 [Ascosphaera acerosa]
MASGKDASRVRSRRSFAQMPRLGSADKENTTSDLSAISRGSKDDSTGDDLAAQRKREKRLRSKSLGPGGVAGLQSDAKGRRQMLTTTSPQSAVSSFPLKSILKPTIPLSPVQPIPSFEETRRRTPGRTPQQASSTAQPAAAAPASELNDPSASPPGPASSQNPYDSFSPVGIPLRTEEQQQAAAREREEQERQERKKQALEHREARRKSLANRRVSFAPEATLHTWNVIEANDDSTTSSAANSTRQESQLGDERDAGDNVAPSSSPESAGPVSTPDASRRRSQVGDRSPDDNVSEYEAFSSSPFGSVIEDGGSIAGRGDEADDDDGGQDDSGSGSDSDPGDTVMTMDTATEHSVVSSDESTNKLDGNLRQAAEEAGTRGIDYDENGDLSMEFTEIQGAFQPWIKKGGNISAEDMTTKFGHDDLAFEQALAGGDVNNQPHAEDTGMITGDISMDITSALGQIMQQPSPVDAAESTTPIDGTPDRRHSSAVDREDQTMEFTAVVGGLSQTATAQHDEPQSSPFKPLPSEHSEANDGDATMELTSVFGDSSIKRGRQWDDFESEDEQRSESGVPETTAVTNFDAQDMEFTRPMGGILSPIVEQTEPQEDVSFTTRVDTTPMREGALVAGAALDAHHSASQQSSDSGSSSRRRHSDTQRHPTAKVSENGSPMPGSPLRMPKTPSDVHTNEHTLPQTPEERLASPTATPGEVPATPDGSTPEQAASVPQEDVIYPELPQDTESPGGGPIGATQPRAAESPEQVTPQRAPSGKPSGLFAENGQHGQATPSFVLRPQLRQTSGLGVDKDGLGSPHVAELLDRRRSIGDEAESFNPAVVATHGVRFNAPDPEARLERQRHAMGPDLDLDSARDATSNLKDLIQSMSPKKKRPAKSIRKSLHTGSARGLLGKRPAELNMEDEEEDLTPKRFRSVEGSPVKSVRLLPPPTKDQTTGRVTSQIDPSNQSAKAMISTTPRVALTPLSLSSQPQSPVLVNQPASVDPQELPQGFRVSQDYQPISLQEFLDMTNVQFMELNTTKRRHTVAPQDQPRTSRDMGDKEVSFADRAVAATTTVPLLEMYQHVSIRCLVVLRRTVHY